MNILKKILKTYQDAYSGLPREAWMLSLTELVNRSGTMVIFFITLYMTQELKFSTIQAGQVMSAYGLGALAGSYFGGKLTDVMGAYTVQKASLLLTGLTFICMDFVASIFSVMVLMFCLALFSETLHPSNATAMSQICAPEMRTRGFALNRLAVNIGVTIGPVAGGFLALIDYSYLFWVDGITCICASTLFFFLFPSSRPGALTPTGDSQNSDLVELLPGTGIEVTENPAMETEHSKSTARKKRSPWKDVYFLKILGLLFLTALVFNQLLSTFPLYFKEYYGFPESNIGALIAVNTVILILFEMITLNALEKVPSIRLVAIGSLLLGTGYALIPLGRGFLFAAFTIAVWTMGEMLCFPPIMTVIANHSDDASRGHYMGVSSLAFACAMTVGPAAGMFVYDRLGPDYPWMFCGILGFVIWRGFSKLKDSGDQNINRDSECSSCNSQET